MHGFIRIDIASYVRSYMLTYSQLANEKNIHDCIQIVISAINTPLCIQIAMHTCAI